MSNQLPENPTNAIVEVGVGPTEVLPTGGDSTAATLPRGCFTIWQQQLKDWASIGAHIRDAGVLRLSRSMALVNQQRLSTVMDELTSTIIELRSKPKKTRSDLALLAQLSQSVGLLAAEQTASQHLLLDVEKSPSPGEEDEPEITVKSFPLQSSGEVFRPPASWELARKREIQTPNGGQPANPSPGD